MSLCLSSGRDSNRDTSFSGLGDLQWQTNSLSLHSQCSQTLPLYHNCGYYYQERREGEWRGRGEGRREGRGEGGGKMGGGRRKGGGEEGGEMGGGREYWAVHIHSELGQNLALTEGVREHSYSHIYMYYIHL